MVIVLKEGDSKEIYFFRSPEIQQANVSNTRFMDKYYNETIHKLETEIKKLEIEIDYCIYRVDSVILFIVECLSEVKEYVQKRGLRALIKKSVFSNIANLPLLPNSFSTKQCIKLKEENRKEQSHYGNT